MFEEQFTRKNFISRSDGCSDWYLVRKGKAGAQCIIMLHGHGSNGDQLIKRQDKIQYQTKFLVEADYNVISPNLRGNSWMSPVAEEDLCMILEQERPMLKWSRLFFIAGSMGGTGALIFAMHHPELLDGVGALGAATDLESYTTWLAKQNLPILRDDIRTAILQAFPLKEALQENSVIYHAGRLTMPVFFYHGGADQIIPASQARSFAEVMKNHPSFIYHEIPGGNHDSPIPFFKEVMDSLLRAAN